ncbi:MAG: HEPN domain-containing protein [archaeon]
MIKQSFLNKLKKEGRLALVEPSEEVKTSYLRKADNCLESARVLLDKKLYENSVINSYYAMYNSVTALLFKAGIKSENHGATIAFLEELFGETELSKIIGEAKSERIDKQYYAEDKSEKPVTEGFTKEMANTAEKFLVRMKVLINKISNKEIDDIREKFEALFSK